MNGVVMELVTLFPRSVPSQSTSYGTTFEFKLNMLSAIFIHCHDILYLAIIGTLVHLDRRDDHIYVDFGDWVWH